jgi:hypothetical protein
MKDLLAIAGLIILLPFLLLWRGLCIVWDWISPMVIALAFFAIVIWWLDVWCPSMGFGK